MKLKWLSIVLSLALGGATLSHAAEGVRVDSSAEKQAWEDRVGRSKVGAGVLLAAGTVGTIAGLAFIVDGSQQRNNAEFKQKGNVLTNEDDVNNGNEKVLKGDVSLLAGAAAIVGGILMIHHVSKLNDEGRAKGFIVGYNPGHKGGETTLAYVYKF
jgi:hypothetical protein